MTLDQLPATITDNLTDGIAVDQSGATFKTTWQKVIPVLLSGLGLDCGVITILGNSSKTLTFDGAAQGIVIVSGINANRHDIVVFGTASGQSVSFSRVINGSQISVSDTSDASAKRLEIASTTSGTLHALVVVFYGTMPTIS